jgi:putative peptidoglycan lipid II flippase
MGLARETVIANRFGATGLVSGFRVATVVPTMLHDLVVGGMVSSALVPVFSEYAESDRVRLSRVAGLMVTLVLLVMGTLTLLVEALAPQIAWLLGGGLPPELLSETTNLVRVAAPSMIFLSLSSVVSGLLYSLRRFALPALTSAVFNAAIVLVTLLAAPRWGIRSVAVGLLAGAILQVLLQTPGLTSLHLTLGVDLRDPVLRRILRLSLPIFAGLLVSQIAIGIDRHLASHAGEQAIAWMQYATTLIQFPLGMVATAVSLSILPLLSRCALALRAPLERIDSASLAPFRSALGSGLRLILLLIVPATGGLLVLAEPIVRLLFQHGGFVSHDTVQTARALRVYLIGLIFAAIDQPLVFAFYAQQDTLTPALVGVAGVVIYLAVALPLLHPLGMLGLVVANSSQWIGHAIIMLWLLRRRLGSLDAQGVRGALVKAVAATLAMTAVTAIALRLVEAHIGSSLLADRLATVMLPAILGLITYGGVLAALRVHELSVACRWIRIVLDHSR